MVGDLPNYWYSRVVFEKGLALIYLIAFIGAVNEFVPLLGARGLLPVSRFIQAVPFRESPSLFYFASTDAAFRIAAWTGVVLSALALAGVPQRLPWAGPATWAALWVLYLSFMNVGQTFYAFGWESLLVDAGFFAIFLGRASMTPSTILMWIWRWTLFRVMFGAGLIKLRGDTCWRDLTCLNYYFETQPIPNPLSWYFHWMPDGVHRAGVVINHIVELGVPFAYFAPQPIASVAGLVTIAFQLALILSGNLSWLNWLTIVLCIATLDDRWFHWLPLHAPALAAPTEPYRMTLYVLAAAVVAMSIAPTLNMLSRNQMMNSSFNSVHLVNTYGAFGSITRARNEIVLEGTMDNAVTDQTTWREYEFKGKPGDIARMPPQIAPYHLRLDWLMWFAAMSTPEQHPWFTTLLVRLLQGDKATLALLRTNPFPDQPPHYVRAQLYRYRFTTPAEHARTGDWWTRELVGEYFPPAALR